MHRVRNAVVIIILCIIGAVTFKSRAPQLSLMPTGDIKDAVAGNKVRRGSPKLTLAGGTGEDLRDSVAGHAVGTPGNDNGNTLGGVGDPPRGSGNGGFGPLNANPNQNQNPPEVISPSGPQEEGPSCEGQGPQRVCYYD